jgi:membrane protein implicated in regulation of membrane protease activity
LIQGSRMTALPALYWLYVCALGLGGLLGVAALFGADAEPDAEPDASAEGDAGEAVLGAWLSTLGVGRVPLGVLLTMNLLLFGGLGLAASELLRAVLPFGIAVWVALPLAALIAISLSARAARWVGRVLPSVETHGARRSDLIGRMGRAELAIDAEFGRAKVVDFGGATHQLRCVTSGPRIGPGTEIVVTDVDERGVFSVEPTNFFEPAVSPVLNVNQGRKS